MKYSKIILAVIVVALFIAPSVVMSGDQMRYEENTQPWTLDTYLSAATATGTSTVVSHDYAPINTLGCVITLASATSNYVNLSLEGSLDGTTYFNLATGTTISIGASTAALLSTVTWTGSTGKPALYTRGTFSDKSGTGATAVTMKCLGY